MIRKGILLPGEALPSSRTIASQIKLNRHTVRAALEELIAEGWIVANERKAYFVAPDFPKPAKRGQHFHATKESRRETAGSGLANLIANSEVRAEKKNKLLNSKLPKHQFNLSSGVPDLRLLPVSELRSAFARAMRQLSAHLDFSGAQGDPLLLEMLKTQLRLQRSILDREVLITHGSQEAIAMTSDLLLGKNVTVAVEEIGYQPAWECFRKSGAEILPIKVDHEGICPKALESALNHHKIRLLYLTPLHQYPTTVTLTPGRRQQIVLLAERHKFAIFEDDYDHDVHFDSYPPAPMASDDPSGWVIYASTLSKVIFPGTRIGFMALPPKLLPFFLEQKKMLSRTNETLAARTIAIWMEEGGFDRHLRRLRKTYQQRRDHLVDYLRESPVFRSRVEFSVPKGGINLWLNTFCSTASLCLSAKNAGVLVSGEHEYVGGDAKKKSLGTHLRLGYAAHTEAEMEVALKKLGKLI